MFFPLRIAIPYFISTVLPWQGSVLHTLISLIDPVQFFSPWSRLREKCQYPDFFLVCISPIWAKYGEIRNISPYLVQMRENMDQKNSEYGHFTRSVGVGLLHFRFRYHKPPPHKVVQVI